MLVWVGKISALHQVHVRGLDAREYYKEIVCARIQDQAVFGVTPFNPSNIDQTRTPRKDWGATRFPEFPVTDHSFAGLYVSDAGW